MTVLALTDARLKRTITGRSIVALNRGCDKFIGYFAFLASSALNFAQRALAALEIFAFTDADIALFSGATVGAAVFEADPEPRVRSLISLKVPTRSSVAPLVR
jgi:hypothetical protein